MVEAVRRAARSNGDVCAYRDKLKAKKGPNAAKVATARRLLTFMYHVLKGERPYIRRRRKANHLKGSVSRLPTPYPSWHRRVEFFL